MSIKTKRAYEEVSKDDGIRVLVDRIWPRGLSKQELKINHWMKQVAPSDQLRKWFNHEPDKFKEFKDKYIAELVNEDEKKEQVEEIKTIIEEKKNVTLIYGAKDKVNNQAVILKEILDTKLI